MNLKTIAVTALTLISYLNTINAMPGAVEVADSVSPGSSAAPIDTVGEPGYMDLEEFVIVQQKKLVESDGAKLTYNVTEDPESGSSNILEILRKVPGVTVDAEDNVKVNGQSSFKILMNNREDPMLKGDLKTVLKSIPASSIKKIEVISEPGAKYEAEGVGGILNIVTDRTQKLSGFMTQLSGWVNAWQAGGYLNSRLKANKVMLDATVSYNNGGIWPRSSTSDSETEDLTGGPNHLLRTHNRVKSGWDYVGVNFNMSWEPDSLNLFTLSGYYSNNRWGNNSWQDRTMFTNDMSVLWSLNRTGKNRGLYNGFGFGASYQHTFGREDHTLVASYEYDFGYNRDNNEYINETLEGESTESPYTRNKEINDYGTHILQIDYSNRFNKHHLLEAGAKFNLNPSNADSRPYFGTNSEDAVMNESLRVKMSQFKDIYAVYGSWSGTFGKWNMKAGVRYEHTRMGLKYKIGEYPDFTTHLNDVVPNAAVSYNITSGSSLRAAYQLRISRPGLGRLNPYVNVLTPGQISYGNPNLKSEKGHNLLLSYSNYDSNKFTGGAKINYRYVANLVNDIIFMKDNVMNTTYANIGKSHAVSLDLNGDWNIIPDLRWSIYASTSYIYMMANSDMLKAKRCGWQFYGNTNLNYKLPCKVRLSAYGGFYTPWLDLQSKGSQNGYYYGIGASRAFLKDDALNISLSAGNFLPAFRTDGYTQADETVRFSSHSRYRQWNVGLSISFKFGGLKSEVKKTAANIDKESHEVEQGGSGNKS